MKQTYAMHRRHIYASINATKGNFTKLSESTLLSKAEQLKLLEVIDKLEELRVEYYNNSKAHNMSLEKQTHQHHVKKTT